MSDDEMQQILDVRSLDTRIVQLLTQHLLQCYLLSHCGHCRCVSGRSADH